MYDVTFYVKEYHDHMLLCVHEQTFSGACFDTLDEIKKWAQKSLHAPDRITKIVDLRTGERIPLSAIE